MPSRSVPGRRWLSPVRGFHANIAVWEPWTQTAGHLGFQTGTSLSELHLDGDVPPADRAGGSKEGSRANCGSFSPRWAQKRLLCPARGRQRSVVGIRRLPPLARRRSRRDALPTQRGADGGVPRTCGQAPLRASDSGSLPRLATYGVRSPPHPSRVSCTTYPSRPASAASRPTPTSARPLAAEQRTVGHARRAISERRA